MFSLEKTKKSHSIRSFGREKEILWVINYSDVRLLELSVDISHIIS